MFDFSPVGGAIAVVGILFMAVIGWRLVRVRESAAGANLFEIESYLFEVRIPEGSEMIGKTIADLEKVLADNNLVLTSLIHRREVQPVPSRRHELVEDDLLILEGSQEDADKFISKNGVKLLNADSTREAIMDSPDSTIAEVVLLPGTRLEGSKIEQVRFKSRYGVNLLGVSREGKPHRGRLKAMHLRAGDVLLIHGGPREVDEAISRFGGFPLAPRGVDFGKRRHGWKALLLFAGAILLSTTGILQIQVALALAVLGLLLLRILSPSELYNGIDWPVIVLLGAMIPVGVALEETGTTTVLAEAMISMGGGMSPVIYLILLLVITMTLSDVLNNAATAILMAPIGSEIASAMKASPDPFLMAIAVGASCAFLTPIGHQNNALIMGPGGYKFGDYWRIGLPLEVIIVLVAIPMILAVWPLYP